MYESVYNVLVLIGLCVSILGTCLAAFNVYNLFSEGRILKWAFIETLVLCSLVVLDCLVLLVLSLTVDIGAGKLMQEYFLTGGALLLCIGLFLNVTISRAKA
jgi:hypothetical protein